MRSLLFVPGDSEKKLARGLESGADALIIDLEDSVAPGAKPQARGVTADFLASVAPRSGRPRLYVRVNALDTGLVDDDLAAVVPAGPDGIVLPKAEGGSSVVHLAAKLAVAEAIAGADDGRIRILAITTETAQAIFALGTYRGASHRLEAMSWGGEDLSAALGADGNRDDQGRWRSPFRLARDLCLMGACAAGVTPVDTVFTAFRDLEGLRAEAEEARRDGFTAKLAIHPAQVPVINEVFTPTPDAIARARAIVAAFAADPSLGVVGIDGEMIDRPHLVRAERLLARAKAAGLA